MRKRIIKLGKTSYCITLSPTLLEFLGVEPKEAAKYTLDVSFKDGALILKDPVKTQEGKK